MKSQIVFVFSVFHLQIMFFFLINSNTLMLYSDNWFCLFVLGLLGLIFCVFFF